MDAVPRPALPRLGAAASVSQKGLHSLGHCISFYCRVRNFLRRWPGTSRIYYLGLLGAAQLGLLLRDSQAVIAVQAGLRSHLDA